jgi:hypothetical protein
VIRIYKYPLIHTNQESENLMCSRRKGTCPLIPGTTSQSIGCYDSIHEKQPPGQHMNSHRPHRHPKSTKKIAMWHPKSTQDIAMYTSQSSLNSSCHLHLQEQQLMAI